MSHINNPSSSIDSNEASLLTSLEGLASGTGQAIVKSGSTTLGLVTFGDLTKSQADTYYLGLGVNSALSLPNITGNDGKVLGLTSGALAWVTGGSGGSQTPWTSNINGDGFSLSNTSQIVSGASIVVPDPVSMALQVTSQVGTTPVTYYARGFLEIDGVRYYSPNYVSQTITNANTSESFNIAVLPPLQVGGYPYAGTNYGVRIWSSFGYYTEVIPYTWYNISQGGQAYDNINRPPYPPHHFGTWAVGGDTTVVPFNEAGALISAYSTGLWTPITTQSNGDLNITPQSNTVNMPNLSLQNLTIANGFSAPYISGVGSGVQIDLTNGNLISFNGTQNEINFSGVPQPSVNSNTAALSFFQNGTDPMYNAIYLQYATYFGNVGTYAQNEYPNATTFTLSSFPVMVGSVSGYYTGGAFAQYDTSGTLYDSSGYLTIGYIDYATGNVDITGYGTVSQITYNAYVNGFTCIQDNLIKCPNMPTADPADGTGTLWADTGNIMGNGANIVYRGT